MVYLSVTKIKAKIIIVVQDRQMNNAIYLFVS